jgi:hypothetical protein
MIYDVVRVSIHKSNCADGSVFGVSVTFSELVHYISWCGIQLIKLGQSVTTRMRLERRLLPTYFNYTRGTSLVQ